MQHQLRYSGTFLSREGIAWQCDILQQSETLFAHVGELTFEADEPLVIEWHEADKEVPLLTSSATLKIESPGDRTYEDLYTIEPGTVRLDVLREGQLYWSGTLDPEFYEEPYERADHYPVTLTFSDFGILDRLKFEGGAGVLRLSAIVEKALLRARLRYDALDYSTLTSLYFAEAEGAEPAEAEKHRATLADLTIVADNFFDEDGSPSTLREVIEGILQPLALRMVQRDGQVWVYDLNGLWHHASQHDSARTPIRWTSDSQTLAVDKVANSVRVNFSAYAQSGAITDRVEFGGKYTGREFLAAGGQVEGTYADGKYYCVGEHTQRDYSTWVGQPSFILYTSRKGRGVEDLHPEACYGRFYPADVRRDGAGSETDCIVWRAQVQPRAWSDNSKEYNDHLIGPVNPAADLYPPTRTLFSTRPAYMPKMPLTASAEPSGMHDWWCSLAIKMELLADPRYNPFRSADATNEVGNHDALKKHSWLVRVPIGVGLYDAEGRPLLHLKKHLTTGAGYRWETGAPSFSDRVFLDYGSPSDGANECGILGWKSNGRIDSGPAAYVDDALCWSERGLIVPYPPEGGWLRVFVYSGIHAFNDADGEPSRIWLDKEEGQPKELIWYRMGHHARLRWLCYKAPEVTVYSNSLAGTKADLDDLEYTGYVNRAAKEEISIDTICGTHTESSPTARGVYTRIPRGVASTETVQLHHLRRAGHTDHPERLLIGTLISQYAHRMTVVRGECALSPSALVYTERGQGGRLFIAKSEVQNAITDTAEATFAEFRPDEWTAIEEVESTAP